MEKNAPTQVDRLENPLYINFNRLVEGYVVLAEVAAEQYNRAAELEQTAMLDPLTGLKNRRALQEAYAGLQEGTGLRRTHDKLNDPELDTHSILVVDVDEFKKINDKNGGHKKGDEILRHVSSIMQHRTRKRDVVSRWGGDEFTILLPRSTKESATMVAEEISNNIESLSEVTVSIGVADLDLTKTLDENHHNADIALYEAKNSGRNKVVTYI